MNSLALVFFFIIIFILLPVILVMYILYINAKYNLKGDKDDKQHTEES